MTLEVSTGTSLCTPPSPASIGKRRGLATVPSKVVPEPGPIHVPEFLCRNRREQRTSFEGLIWRFRLNVPDQRDPQGQKVPKQGLTAFETVPVTGSDVSTPQSYAKDTLGLKRLFLSHNLVVSVQDDYSRASRPQHC